MLVNYPNEKRVNWISAFTIVRIQRYGRHHYSCTALRNTPLICFIEFLLYSSLPLAPSLPPSVTSNSPFDRSACCHPTAAPGHNRTSCPARILGSWPPPFFAFPETFPNSPLVPPRQTSLSSRAAPTAEGGLRTRWPSSLPLRWEPPLRH